MLHSPLSNSCGGLGPLGLQIAEQICFIMSTSSPPQIGWTCQCKISKLLHSYHCRGKSETCYNIHHIFSAYCHLFSTEAVGGRVHDNTIVPSHLSPPPNTFNFKCSLTIFYNAHLCINTFSDDYYNIVLATK